MIQILSILLILSTTAFAVESVPSQSEYKARLSASLESTYGSIALSPIASGVFYDLVVPLSAIEQLSGAESSEIANSSRWRQAAFEMSGAALAPSNILTPQEFQSLRSNAARDRIDPILILDYQFERLRSGLTREEAVTELSDGTLEVRAGATERGRVFSAVPLYGKTYHGASAQFQIDFDSYFFTNRERPAKIEIDFDDGLGFRAVGSDEIVTVHYTAVGRRTIRVQITDNDGQTSLALGEFQVITLEAPALNATWNITADLSYNGVFATGEAYIYLAPGHSDVTRPMIVSDGFDIDNSMFWDQLYELLNQETLIETARTLGYDIVVLNYTNSTTYLQANAYVVEALLDTIEQIIPANQTYVMVGPSMGGLTMKYALTHLESIGDPANVRTYFSFDSPHRGAVIPLGLQYWVNYFSGLSAEAGLFRDALNSPAARQMLIQHFTDPPSGVASADPLRATFLNDIAALGSYPALPRKVALANGSANQVGMSYNPGQQIIQYVYNPFSFNIRGNVWAVNNAGSQQIFSGRAVALFIPLISAQDVTISATSPWDNAPGGTSNSMQQMDQVVAPYGDIVALHNNHCFIPSISALDLNTTDPFFNIAGEPNLYSMTPFDSLYFPAANQEHVLVTPENYWWIIEELADSLPAPTVVIHSDASNVHLNWTKTPATRSYHVYSSTNPSTFPVAFTSVADTSFSEPVSTDIVKFYRVVASTQQ